MCYGRFVPLAMAISIACMVPTLVCGGSLPAKTFGSVLPEDVQFESFAPFPPGARLAVMLTPFKMGIIEINRGMAVAKRGERHQACIASAYQRRPQAERRLDMPHRRVGCYSQDLGMPGDVLGVFGLVPA